MNSLLLAIILIPALEIYLFIKIGSSIGAFNTVLLIFFTAFIGIYYARAQGLNTLNQGLRKMVKEEMPIYELISGALIAIGAIFLIIFPLTRKLIFKKFTIKSKNKNYKNNNDYIEGEYKDIDE